ncbi:hypothetical protein [Clostridium beijerinckii]|uniref:hypothetical protein n=1 Tax=Clostridium beijerinckii TaxID=1520 RepID=UPI00098CC0E4|nr:hypothetical protein [Clostridium beijerinckii]NRT78646.1 hypothetical protein [Clostridium beijerinckii]OOM41370.1 hypothetical protein CBEIJ_44880 [Clostridium beijerinckii]
MSDIQNLTASLDLKQNLNIYAACKQSDNLKLILLVYDNSIQANLTNYTVRMRAMKADKVPLIQEHTGITITNNVVTIVADEQLTTTPGKTLIELQFINSITGEKKATFNLVLVVSSSTFEIDRKISTATYTLLQELENKLDQATDYFQNVENFQNEHPDLLDLDNRVTANTASLSQKVNGVNRIITDANKSILGLAFPCTCTQLAEALANGDIITGFESIISDVPTTYGSFFGKKIDANRVELEFRGLYNSGIYIASYRNSSIPKFSGWRRVDFDDSGWLALPLSGGITNYDNAKYRKIGSVVFLNGRITGIVGTSGTVGTLPNGYRPLYNFNCTVILSAGKTANLSIDTSGIITIYSVTTLASTDFIGLNCSFAI